MFKKFKITLYFLIFLTTISAYAISTKTYKYDNKKNTIQITDPRGAFVDYDYDTFDRLI